MPNKHITQFLDYYNTELSNPQYAVLLKGKWGSGKTHFINEYKKKLDKKYIYVSLYGVKSYDEIETKFLQSSNPEIFNKKTIYAGKIANAFISNKVKKSLSFLKKSLSSLNAKGNILILDDLERCSINIVDLLGYINYFVEHQSYNVILIANEEEFNEEKKYKEIKEKLIGKTFELKSSSTLAYDSFLTELEKEKDIFIEYKNEILEIFEQSECNNLRILRQSILDLQRLYSRVLNTHTENSELIKNFIKIYLIIYIEMKKGEYNFFDKYLKDRDHYNDIESAKRLKNDLEIDRNSIEDDKDLVNFKEFIRKYKINNNTFNLILDIGLWKDIINDSFIDSERIDKVLKESQYYYNENTPSWKRLANYHNLTDEELPELLNEVYTEFKANYYDKYLENKLISSMLLYFSEEDLFEINSEKLFNECKEVFETYFKKNKDYTKKIVFNNHGRFFYDRSYDHLGFFTSESFTKLNDSIREMIKVEKINILKNDSLELLHAIEEKNTDNLLFLLEGSKDKDIISYSNEAILKYVDVKTLFEVLKKTNGITMHFFGGIIKDRYVNGFDELLKEESFLEELLVLSDKYILSYKGKLSAFNLKREIKENLIIAIDKIENIKEEKRGNSIT